MNFMQLYQASLNKIILFLLIIQIFLIQNVHSSGIVGGESARNMLAPLGQARILLKSINHYYLSTDRFLKDKVVADRLIARDWEIFIITNDNGTDLKHGDLITIQSTSRKYLSIVGCRQDPSNCKTMFSDQIYQSRDQVTDFEKFRIYKEDPSIDPIIYEGDRISLQSSKKLFCTAELGGGWGSNLSCNRQRAQGWELFTAYRASSLELDIQDKISKLTVHEVISQLYGNGHDSQVDEQDRGFGVNGVKRLGIPLLRMCDAGLGARYSQDTGGTAFPSGLSMGASFNPNLIAEISRVIGQEAKALGCDVILGPNINISRIPIGGRNFETFGEDPYLTSILTSSYIKSLQKQKVIATPKHLLLNDQEHLRTTIDIIADKLTMEEIYLPPFRASVQAGAWSMMTSYNKVNGVYTSENKPLILDRVKGPWGFPGFIMSDWWGNKSSYEAANAGLDLEMPSGDYFSKLPNPNLDKNPPVSLANMYDKLSRRYRAMGQIGLFAQTVIRPPKSIINSDENKKIALDAATESIVLLKNSGVLPLNPIDSRKLALIGPLVNIYTRGGGSSYVPTTSAVTPMRGIQDYLGRGIATSVEVGLSPRFGRKFNLAFNSIEAGNNIVKKYLVPDVFANGLIRIKDVEQNALNKFNLMSMTESLKHNDIFTVQTNDNKYFSASLTDDRRVRANASAVLDREKFVIEKKQITQNALVSILNNELISGDEVFIKSIDGKYCAAEYGGGVGSYLVCDRDFPLAWETFTLEFDDLDMNISIQRAVNIARQAPAAIVFVGHGQFLEGENLDKTNMSLPIMQNKLIKEVSKVNKNTIVVIQSGGPIEIDNILQNPNVSAILQAWYPGEQGGAAIANIIFGTSTPSGKLPMSWPKKLKDSSGYDNYPNPVGGSTENMLLTKSIVYDEGLFVGYRFFELFEKLGFELEENDFRELSFPFGFGLSYMDFKISNIHLDIISRNVNFPDVRVSVLIENLTKNSSIESGETVQLYLGYDNNLNKVRPIRELKGFKKVFLKGGESTLVNFMLEKSSFSQFNPLTERWMVNPGSYTIFIGNSYENITQIANVILD